MQFTISSSLLYGHLSDKIEQVAKSNYSAIDINRLDLVTCDKTPAEIDKMARKAGISVHKYQMISDVEGLRSEARTIAFTRLEYELRIANELGAQIILLGSSTVIGEDVSEDEITSDLWEAAELAEKYDIKIAFIAMPWAVRDRTNTDAYARVCAVNHSFFGLGLSSYFDLTTGSKAAVLREFDGTKILSVQLADAPISDFDISRLKHEFACLPGLGDLNLVSYVRAINACGYEGKWSLARMGRRTGLGDDRAQNGYRAITNLFDETSKTLPENQLDTPPLPQRANLRGYEYLEFALDQTSAIEICELLETLCFRLERKHRSKQVELWRQGAINIVLNTSNDGLSNEIFQASGPSLSELGLRVIDASCARERACALGVENLSQCVGEGEIDIPSIAGVGRSIIRFIDEKSKIHHVWNIEFEPTLTTQSIQPAGLRRIDHLSQTMSQEKLDHWLLFFLSVFDMKKSPLVDVQDPAGIIYSRSVESPEGEVRLNLNGASSHQTFSGAFLQKHHHSVLQHMAFASDDIFETSARLFETGFKRLEIPANYYDSIQAKYGLDDVLTSTLKKHNILYSHNKTGKFFQLYSQPIWGGFFVEIVERKDGYLGYGASNAPVRIAAQSQLRMNL